MRISDNRELYNDIKLAYESLRENNLSLPVFCRLSKKIIMDFTA